MAENKFSAFFQNPKNPGQGTFVVGESLEQVKANPNYKKLEEQGITPKISATNVPTMTGGTSGYAQSIITGEQKKFPNNATQELADQGFVPISPRDVITEDSAKIKTAENKRFVEDAAKNSLKEEPIKPDGMEGMPSGVKSPQIAQIDDEIDSYINQLNQYKSNMSAANTNLLSSIQQSYQTRKAQMEDINRRAVKGLRGAAVSSGLQRYAPQISQGIITSQEQAGIAKLAELDALEQSALAEAQNALLDREYRVLNDAVQNIQAFRKEKNDLLAKQAQLAIDAEKEFRENIKFELEMDKYQEEISQLKMKNASEYASAVATGLVEFDESYNVKMPSASSIANAAEQIGIDPNVLSRAVFDKVNELQKIGSEEYGTYFERQKYAAELAQLDIENAMEEQKFELEKKLFGLKVSESGYTVVGDQLVRIDDGEVGGAAEWAKQIADGKLKMSDVPTDIKTDVVKKLGTLPPKKEDIDKVNKKIAELDDILKHPGLEESVGPQGISRIDWWAFSGAKQGFIGSVQQLLSEKTLKSLIDAKADGATFGALSEGELRILESAATKIGTWAVRDKDDRVVGYKISEKEFKQEIEKIKGEYEELVRKFGGEAAVQPYSGLQDFHKRATQDDRNLYFQFDQEPEFNGKSVNDIIDAVNLYNGFEGEKGSGLLGVAIKENFPAGENGGQCGTFAHKIVNFKPVGDKKEEKFAAVDKFGIQKSDWKPEVGDVVITNEHPTWGHVAIVNEVLPNGQIVLSESNYNGDERVSHTRKIDYLSPRIYGAIRGSYKI